MNRKSLQQLIGIVSVALFLAGCTVPTPTPASMGEVVTPTGRFEIVQVEISDRFPPGCTPATPGCQQAASGYKVLVIWLNPKDSLDPMEGGIRLQKDASSAYLTASDGSRTKGAGGGLISEKWFILFTPPTSASNFTLDWFDNPPIKLGTSTPASPTSLAITTSVPPTATPAPPTASPTATPVPPTPAVPIPMDGRWVGTTSSDGPVSFDISDHGTLVTNFQLTTGGTCAISGGICAYSIFPTIHDFIAIATGQFVYNTSTYSFDGKFTSATAVSGNFVFNEYGATCMTGGPIPRSHTCYHSATGTWAATRTEETTLTSTPQPTVTPTRTPTLQPSATPTPKVGTGTVPILESVNLRYDTSSGSLVIFQDVTFHDPDGDSYWVDYELVHTTAAGVEVRSGAIEISSRQQKLGATITGKWTCGGSKYDVTLRVTILDRAGNRSNAVEYTMNCR